MGTRRNFYTIVASGGAEPPKFESVPTQSDIFKTEIWTTRYEFIRGSQRFNCLHHKINQDGTVTTVVAWSLVADDWARM